MEVCAELNRISTQWELEHPQDAFEDVGFFFLNRNFRFVLEIWKHYNITHDMGEILFLEERYASHMSYDF